MTEPSATRLHYMDAMRSVLMLLGVVVHSLRPYDSFGWAVKDPHRVPAFDALVATLHLFRMPAFFVISGFFAMYLLGRWSTGTFLRERMRRVLVPLLAMLLSVNLVQAWFLGRLGTGSFVDDRFLPALWSGQLVSHLWFLACLVVYFALVALLAPALRHLTAPTTQAWLARSGPGALCVLLAAAVLGPLGAAVVGRLAGPEIFNAFVFGLITPFTVLGYLPFFVVGLVLSASPELLDRFARSGPSVIVLGACGALGMYLVAGREDTAWRALEIVSRSLLVWMAVRVVFSAFRKWADRPSSTFRYLSSASYSIYLFHHLIVIVIATWLLPLELDGWLKFPIVLTTAALVSLALHHFLVRRYALLGYLFNGRAIVRAPRERGVRDIEAVPNRAPSSAEQGLGSPIPMRLSPAIGAGPEDGLFRTPANEQDKRRS